MSTILWKNVFSIWRLQSRLHSGHFVQRPSGCVLFLRRACFSHQSREHPSEKVESARRSPNKLQLAADIERFSTIHEARTHLNEYKHLYSRKLALLAFQKALLLAIDRLHDAKLTSGSSPVGPLQKYVDALARCGVPMSPKLLAVFGEGLSKLKIPFYDMLHRYVVSDDGDFDVVKFRGFVDACLERQISQRVLWQTVADVLAAGVGTMPWSELLPFLSLQTKQRCTRGRLSTRVQARLKAEGFADIEFTELLTLLAYLNDIGPLAVDMSMKTVKEVMVRPLDKPNTHALIEKLADIAVQQTMDKWIMESLLGRVADQLLKNPMKHEACVWLALLTFHKGYEKPLQFCREAPAHIAKRLSELPPDGIISFLSFVSQERFEAELNEAAHLVQSFLPELAANNLCVVLAAVSKSSTAGTPGTVSDICTCFVNKIGSCSDKEARAAGKQFLQTLQEWTVRENGDRSVVAQQCMLDLLNTPSVSKDWVVLSILQLSAQQISLDIQVLQRLMFSIKEHKLDWKMDAHAVLQLSLHLVKSGPFDNRRQALQQTAQLLISQLSQLNILSVTLVVDVLKGLRREGLDVPGSQSAVQDWLQRMRTTQPDLVPVEELRELLRFLA